MRNALRNLLPSRAVERKKPTDLGRFLEEYFYFRQTGAYGALDDVLEKVRKEASTNEQAMLALQVIEDFRYFEAVYLGWKERGRWEMSGSAKQGKIVWGWKE